MPVLKKGEIKVRATAYGTEVKSTGYVFYSYDKNSSALFFQFRNQNGEPTDIANAKIHLLMILEDDEGKEFIPGQEDFEIISKPGGKAKFVLPEMLLSYQGKVTGYIYLDFEDGSQTDEGQFTFRIRRSMITHVLPAMGDKYVQDFEDIKERVEQAEDSTRNDFKDSVESTGKAETKAKNDMQDSVDQVNKDYETWKETQENNQTTFENDFLDWKTYQEKKQTDFESDTNETINGINTKVEETQTKISDLEEWVPNADDLATKQYVDESVEGFNETITTQLAQNISETANKKNKIPIELARKVKNKVVIPDNFNWKDVPINVYINGVGEFSTDLDVEKYRPTGKTYYVNKNGSDSNNGLTEKTAFSTVHKARDMSDVVEIIIGGGVYQDSQAFDNNGTGVSGYKNLSIIGKEGEDVFLTTRRITNFTSVSGRINVFQTPRSLVASVWDVKNKDSDGDYNKIEQVNTLDECEQNAGSYYTDGSVLYVHRVDGLKPDADGENTAVYLDLENFYNSGGHVTYLENIHFEGGNDGCVKVYDNTGNAKLYAKNCTFKYSKNGNGGLNVQGVDTITEDCIASCNMKDGFNYHYVKPYRQNVIEINGVGRNNGFDGSNQNNGSTSHDGIKIIRVNGKYHNNQGPNCHDVSVDSESWNLGCESFKSRATNADRRTNYQIEGGTMFLDGCVGYESHKAIVVSSTGTMYKRKTLFDDGIKYITGVLEDY